ncbi:MAG: hypothetical protein FWH36_00115 [Lentimicrobiaceae bacterium]|nr:hypothetical protein [Lentimicrobiaceae bacterium]
MKKGLNIPLLILFSVFGLQNHSDLFSKIENEELISKQELSEYIYFDLSKYENYFQGVAYANTNTVQIGHIQGRKSDTVFDILIIFKNDVCLNVKEYPNSTFHKVDNTIHREYILGETFTDIEKHMNPCITVHYLKFEPILDTLENKFDASQAIIILHDSIVYCDEW